MLRQAWALFLVALVAVPALGWNAAGHRIIAAMAYDQLTPVARARVDDLIRRHPDYESIFLKDAPADETQRARFAFMNAAVWPDLIRSDPRFYAEDRADAVATPLLPGFPDMGRHGQWHYIDMPFSQDGTRGAPPESPNALTEMKRLSAVLALDPSDPANPAYALPWLLHLVGDVHNPLHTVSRFSRELPDGDRGGNLVFLEGGRNLHAFWDNLPGDANATYDTLNAQIGEILQRNPVRRFESNPDKWIENGVDLAKKDVYIFGLASGSKARPVHLPKDYQGRANVLYRKQLALAATAVADLLNRRWDSSSQDIRSTPLTVGNTK